LAVGRRRRPPSRVRRGPPGFLRLRMQSTRWRPPG
jgi:hypothetical protein